MNDQQLIDLLTHDSVRYRSAALDLLASSYCNAPAMLGAILDAWDRFGVSEAYPEFAQVTHLPVHHQYIANILERSFQMVEGRKLVDPVCRCAGKIVEALVLLPAEQLGEFLPEIERLKSTSKIFFRIELHDLKRRLALTELSDDELKEHFEPIWNGSSDVQVQTDAVHALEILHGRGVAEEVIRRCLSPSEDWEQDAGPRLSIALQVASRHAFLGFEDMLAVHIQHLQATVAATACIALARCRSRDAVFSIVERFAHENPTTQLRMTDVLGRLRVPGASVRIQELREACKDPKICDALNLAQILHFDFGQIDNWMEALFVLSDPILKRYRHLVELALPLSDLQPEGVRRHIEEALRIRA